MQAAKAARATAFPAHEFEEQGGNFFRGKGCMRTALEVRSRTSNTYAHVSVARDDGHGKAHGTFALADWLRDTCAADLHEYEVLHGAVRLYMDLEWKPELIKPLVVDPQETIETVVQAARDALALTVNPVEGVAIATASGFQHDLWKESFHIVFHTPMLFPNAKTTWRFISEHVLPRLPAHLRVSQYIPTGFLDSVPYGSSQCFRFLGQSKDEAILRPLRAVHGWTPDCRMEPEMFLIGDYAGTIPIWTPPTTTTTHEKAEVKGPKKTGAPKTLLCEAHGFIVELCELIPDIVFDDNKMCYTFINAVWGALDDKVAARALILTHYNRVEHKKAQTSEAYVDSVIARYATDSVKVGTGTLVWWARKAGNSAAVAALNKKYGKGRAHRLTIIKAETSIVTEEYSERYVRPFVFDGDVDTLVIMSHLGTGKTRQILVYVKGEQPERILALSMRKAFTHSVKGDWRGEGVPFETYLDITGPLGEVNRIIVQMESLHRLGKSSTYTTVPITSWDHTFKEYDLVVLDESESALNQMSSLGTHGDFHMANCETFEHIIRGAKKLICGDAFISRRTLAFIEELRDPARSRYIINTCCPYERTATELFAMREGKSKGGLSRVCAYAGFCKMIMESLERNERLVVIWTSKRRGQYFVDTYLKEWSTKRYRWYNAGDTKYAKDLEDVEAVWSNIQLLMYTSTITVGVNYKPVKEEHKFNRIFLYGCAATTNPRDIAQSLLRVREITTNNLVFTLDNSCFKYPASGRDAIEAEMRAEEAANRLTNPTSTWRETPKWLWDVHIHNKQEEADKSFNYREGVMDYLQLSGYTVTEQQVSDSKERIDFGSVEYEEVPEITRDVADEIEERSHHDLATTEEKIQLQKFKFQEMLTEEGLTHAAGIWAAYSEGGKWELFWNVVSERHLTLEQVMASESKARYAAITNRRAAQRRVLDKVLRILGWTSSAQGGAIHVSDVAERIMDMKTEIASAFLQDGASRAKADRKGEGQVMDLINAVFSHWNGIKGESDGGTRVRVKGGGEKRVTKFTLVIQSLWLWNIITPKYDTMWMGRGWVGREKERVAALE